MPYTTASVGAESFADFLLTGLQRESVVIAAGARVIRFAGRSLHVPVAAAATPTWVPELTEIPEDDATADEIELIPQKVAALMAASNEAIGDSSAELLTEVGDDLVRRVALVIDDALLTGAGHTAHEPQGLVGWPGLPTSTAHNPATYSGLANGAAIVRAAGGKPDTAFVHPSDHLDLQLATDGSDRPLLQSTEDGPAEVVAGLRVWPTPAVSQGYGLVCEAGQILVGLRQDASLSVSSDAAFGRDAALIRATARVDVAPADVGAFVLLGDEGEDD